jgi:uncharacterized membrane protein YraQ (UPF0718 family)
MTFNEALYGITVILLLVSTVRDQKKTRAALKKAWMAFLNILPDFSVVLALIGLILTYLSPSVIVRVVGSGSGILGILLASVVGSITLIPGFVAFPLAASLFSRGAGVAQIAVFVSTLMMVGIVTLPLEIRYFGKREAIVRNSLAYLFSFVVAAIIGVVVRG